MLVIRRRAGESLLIGSDVEIEILDVTPNRVRIGIRAPASCAVVRKEVAATREANLNASRLPSPQAIAWLSSKLNASGK